MLHQHYLAGMVMSEGSWVANCRYVSEAGHGPRADASSR